MKTLKNIIDNINYINLVLEEYSLLEANDIINESFKSSILSKLAKAVYDAEKFNNNRKIEQQKRYQQHDKEQGYSYANDNSRYKPKLINFASIFGPTIKTNKLASKKEVLYGLKWSEIKDSDFTIYKPDDKQLFKLIKSTYQKATGNADFIIAGKNDDIIAFIKAYGTNDNCGLYYFKYGDKWGTGVLEFTKPHYSSARSYNANDVVAFLKALAQKSDNVKVYALEITNDMIKSYNVQSSNRIESQQGVINYDEKSLNSLLKQQKARYKVLADEMRAKKLQADPDMLFDEIKKVNDDVVELYKKVMNDPENLDKYFDMGNLMNYVSYAYESFYKSFKSIREGDKMENRAKDKGMSIRDAKGWRKYHDESAKEYINNAKEYLEKVKKMIKDIENELV